MKKTLMMIAMTLMFVFGLQSSAFAQWAMSESDYIELYNAVVEETFSSNRADLVKSAIEHGALLTCRQVAELISIINFDSDKVSVAAAAYDAVIDPQNWYLVYEVFSFDSDKRKLKELTDGVREPAHHGHHGHHHHHHY